MKFDCSKEVDDINNEINSLEDYLKDLGLEDIAIKSILQNYVYYIAYDIAELYYECRLHDDEDDIFPYNEVHL